VAEFSSKLDLGPSSTGDIDGKELGARPGIDCTAIKFQWWFGNLNPASAARAAHAADLRSSNINWITTSINITSTSTPVIIAEV
jgi:hypothetical protein